MKRYFAISIESIRNCGMFKLPDPFHIEDCVMSQNEMAIAYDFPELEDKWVFIVECDNPPRDMPLWGLYWEQLPPELFGE